MSKELDQYLDSMPVYQFRLVDGSTVLAKLIDIDDSNNVHLQDAHEVHLEESNETIFDVSIHKYMYMSEERKLTINLDKVISHSEASRHCKNFYSKAVLHSRMRDMVNDIQSDHKSTFASDIFKSFIDGLDNQDYKEKYRGWDGHPKPWPPEEDI